MIRPMTSNVSALSGFVANRSPGHAFVSSAPSKIPYGGFSPVRLQTGCQQRPSLPLQLIRCHSGDLVRARLIRSRTCVRRHSRLLTPPTRPVALGSASGYAVRQPHRLLWPHPSFCRPRRVYILMPAVSRPAEGPHFYPQSLMTCRRPYSDGSSDPPTNQIADLAFTPLIKVRQPFAPHTGLRVVISRSCNVHIPLRPVILLAPLRTGLLRPSLPAPDRSKGRSVITTGTFVSFLTGLAPAALPALWAAHQGNQING
jgi:hypothetical protein